MRIIYLDKPSYLPPPAIDRLRLLGDVEVFDDLPSEDEAVARLSSTDIAIVEWTDITKEMLQKISRLQYIVLVTTGYEFVDVKSAREFGVLVSNTPEYSRQSVAEHVFAQTLALNKHVCKADQLVRSTNGEASYTSHSVGVELYGKTLGVLGLGSIGSWVAQIGHGFDMRVIGNTKSPKQLPGVSELPLEDVLKESDILSVCFSVNPSTIGLLDRTKLSLLKPSALLVNIASNKILDEEYLAEMLQTGKLRGAACDHVEGTSLLGLDNVLLSPGTAWYTQESLDRNVDMFVSSVEKFVQGEPQFVVN